MASINTRHSQEGGGAVFVTRPDEPEGTVEVVCSSSRRRMDHFAKYQCYRLFSHTLTLDPTPLSSWPQHTDVHCWNCCHQFDTVPVSIPRSTTSISKKSYYEVYGVFCSLNCAKKSLLENHSHDQQQLLMQLNELCVNVYGMDTDSVFNAKEAPPRIFLKMFGGHMDIEEYRSKSVNVRTVLVTPPFVSHAMVLEEHSVDKSEGGDTVIEPLREGQHELRGLRRPTRVATDTRVTSGTESKFDAYMKTRRPNQNPRPTKRHRKETAVESEGGLNMFLKS